MTYVINSPSNSAVLSIVKLIPAILLIYLTSCASIQTTTNVEPSGEFDRYQTFYCGECLDEFDRAAPEYDKAKNRELIRLASAKELKSRGYIEEKENPDLLIDFHIVIDQKSDVVGEAYPMAWQTHDFAFYPMYYSYGTLIIHFVDNHKQQLVWQGTASKILENPRKAEKTIAKAIEKIFKQYDYTAL